MLQCLGNHEFDDGVEDVALFIRNITIPVVACNLDLTNEPLLVDEPNLMKSKVLTLNGRKIGIIGYLTPETAVSITHTYPLPIHVKLHRSYILYRPW